MALISRTCVFLSFSVLLLPPSKAGPCSVPKDKTKATYHETKETYMPGETLSFSCNTGFRLKGSSSKLQCEKNGMWKPKTAKCEMIKCEPLTIPNGKISNERRRFNANVSITCIDGYTLTGPSAVTCGADGSWTPAVPTCKQGMCQLPPYFPNAYTAQGNQKHYEPDTAVRYKCNHGYRTVRGSNTIYCRNGRWTDLELICEKKKCGSAGEIENGFFRYTGSSFGDTATATCNEGHYLVGVNVRHCKANGWDGRIPVCEAVQCPEPPLVPYADLDFDTSGIIKYGHMASYRCRFGTLIGAKDIICTKNGTWSPEAPLCKVLSDFKMEMTGP